MIPKRIQRRRTKGWKAPDGAICVTRPGKFGNPFIVGTWARVFPSASTCSYLMCWEEKYAGPGYVFVKDNSTAVILFREWLTNHPRSCTQELRGKDLMCWCRLDQPCHADVLLEIANA